MVEQEVDLMTQRAFVWFSVSYWLAVEECSRNGGSNIRQLSAVAEQVR